MIAFHCRGTFWCHVQKYIQLLFWSAEARRKLVMHLGMFDDLWSAASLVPAAREDGMDVYLAGNRNCPPFVRGALFRFKFTSVSHLMHHLHGCSSTAWSVQLQRVGDSAHLHSAAEPTKLC